MKLRPEFELLDAQFMQLHANKDVDQDFLRKVGDNIRLCEHIVEREEERSIITRTTYWCRKRESDMIPKLMAGPAKTKEEIEADDARFLRSIERGIMG